MADVDVLVNAIIAAATANAQAAHAQVAATASAQAAVFNQPAQQQAPQFARFPGAAGAGALDFNKAESIKLFNKAIGRENQCMTSTKESYVSSLIRSVNVPRYTIGTTS
jgi:hypothetical protein